MVDIFLVWRALACLIALLAIVVMFIPTNRKFSVLIFLLLAVITLVFCLLVLGTILVRPFLYLIGEINRNTSVRNSLISVCVPLFALFALNVFMERDKEEKTPVDNLIDQSLTELIRVIGEAYPEAQVIVSGTPSDLHVEIKGIPSLTVEEIAGIFVDNILHFDPEARPTFEKAVEKPELEDSATISRLHDVIQTRLNTLALPLPNAGVIRVSHPNARMLQKALTLIDEQVKTQLANRDNPAAFDVDDIPF